MLPFVLLVPTLVVLGLLLGYPLVRLVLMSFQDFGMRQQFGAPAPWVGLANYRGILGNSYFWSVLVRTLLFCAMTWSFAAFSAIGLAQSLRAWTWPAGRLARMHALIVSLACCAVALYLWRWKVLGLRTWVW